jgi:hypothetical protein
MRTNRDRVGLRMEMVTIAVKEYQASKPKKQPQRFNCRENRPHEGKLPEAEEAD